MYVQNLTLQNHDDVTFVGVHTKKNVIIYSSTALTLSQIVILIMCKLIVQPLGLSDVVTTKDRLFLNSALFLIVLKKCISLWVHTRFIADLV